MRIRKSKKRKKRGKLGKLYVANITEEVSPMDGRSFLIFNKFWKSFPPVHLNSMTPCSEFHIWNLQFSIINVPFFDLWYAPTFAVFNYLVTYYGCGLRGSFKFRRSLGLGGQGFPTQVFALDRLWTREKNIMGFNDQTSAFIFDL